MYREPNRKGETEKLAWGRCCKCENSGAIMSWPKCRFCLHNRCGLCEYSEESTTLDGEEGGEGLTISARFDKMKELSGEMELEVEALVAKGALTSQDVSRIVEVLHALNLSLLEAEEGDGGSEGEKLEEPTD